LNDEHRDADEERFRAFFICTGNRCRSPFAASLFGYLTRDLPVDVGSAGTLDSSPYPAPPEIIGVAKHQGLDLSTHRSQSLSIVDLRRADLVIGFELAHVAAAVVQVNAPADKTFTLPELDRLLNQVGSLPDAPPVERARNAVARAHQHRISAARFVTAEEVRDPFGGSKRGYEEMAAQITSMCEGIVAQLFRRRAA
jgi:protein-tyrosine phosphatase